MAEQVRRVVTAHDKEGKAVVLSDEQVAIEPFPGLDGSGALMWTTGKVPADNVTDTEGNRRASGLTLRGGSALRVTEIGPGAVSPMHRTFSIDYVYVVFGELELGLDGGEAVLLRAGDISIQRGTNHTWRNPSATKLCRFLVSMIESEPVTVDGAVLAKDDL